MLDALASAGIVLTLVAVVGFALSILDAPRLSGMADRYKPRRSLWIKRA